MAMKNWMDKRAAMRCKGGLLCVVAATWGVVVMFAIPAHANLIVNPVYDSTVTGLANFASVQSAFTYAAAQFENTYTNNVTVNITVTSTSDPTVLSTNIQSFIGPYNFFKIKSLLTGHETSAADVSAVASLGNVDPTGGGQFWLTQPQAKIFGQPIVNLTSDGTFTFGTSESYTFDPANRAVNGKFDFIGLAEHELSEILGRDMGLGSYDLGGKPAYVVNDLFRFKSAGTRSVVHSDTGVYFSVNDGTTALKNFNSTSPGDVSDWAAGAGADAFNAFDVAGVEEDLSPTDFMTVDVVGFDVPEPASFAIVVLACGINIARRKPRKY